MEKNLQSVGPGLVWPQPDSNTSGLVQQQVLCS